MVGVQVNAQNCPETVLVIACALWAIVPYGQETRLFLKQSP